MSYIIEHGTQNMKIEGKLKTIPLFTVVLLDSNGARVKGIQKYHNLSDAEERKHKLEKKNKETK